MASNSFAGRLEHLARETIELVFDGLNDRGRVLDGGFARLTRALVKGELAPRLRVALGVQLRHASRETRRAEWAAAVPGAVLSPRADLVLDVRSQPPHALVCGRDLMAQRFAGGPRIGCHRGADRAQSQERLEVAALRDPSRGDSR